MFVTLKLGRTLLSFAIRRATHPDISEILNIERMPSAAVPSGVPFCRFDERNGRVAILRRQPSDYAIEESAFLLSLVKDLSTCSPYTIIWHLNASGLRERRRRLRFPEPPSHVRRT